MRDFFIKTIGKWLGLDLKYYIKNNAYLLTAQGVVLLSGLATSVVLARLLPKEDYGQYNYFFSIIGILAISALPGMGVAFMQAAANKFDRVFIKGTKVRLKWSLSGAVLCLLIGTYYYYHGETSLGICFMVSSLFLPFYASFDGFYPFLQGRQRFDLSAKYRAIYWIVLTLVVILTVYVTEDFLWVIIVYLATATTLEVVFLFKTIRTSNLSDGEDEAAITYGKKLTGIQAIGIAALRFDKLIIGVALGYSELAAYSIATMIANLPTVLLASVSQTIFPKTATMDEKVAYSEVKRRLPWLLAGMVIVCGIGALLCPYVIPWLYSSKYLDSVLYTQLLFIPMILGTLATVLRRGALQAQRKTRELFKLNLSVSVFELMAMVLLALNFGIIGIVAAKALARTFDSVYSWILTR